LKTKQKIYAILLLSLLIGVAFYTGYTLAQSESTFTISSGVYPSSSDFIIWREGNEYHTKNAYGYTPSFSGSTNCSYVIMSCIDALPHVLVEIVDEAGGSYNREFVSAPHGVIEFTGQNFTIITKLQIPIGSRIALKGRGVSYQAIALGRRGGTRFIGQDSSGILWACHNSTTVTSSSGSKIRIEDIEFYQQTALSGAGIDVLTLTAVC